MSVTDWLAIIAIVISSGALFLEIRRWFESKPHLDLTVMRDAISFPYDDGKPKLALTVINRGGTPTTLTHAVGFLFASRWQKLRRKPYQAWLVNSPKIPAELGVNKTWIDTMLYNDETLEGRAKGHLYVGVIAAHRNREFLIRVPAKGPNVPKEKGATETSAATK